ncbi:MAG: DUF4382 domain-containing protein [Prolixibacteraceae bacterium]
MKTTLRLTIVLLAAVVTAFFTACTEDENMGNENEKGTISMLLTDAPFPGDQVAEANIVIDRIEIRKDKDPEVGDTAEFFLVSEELQEFNLLDLRNGITSQIGEAELEAGIYDQIRLHIVEANIVLNDEENTVFDLKIPSGTSSGLKINIVNGLEVTGGSTNTLILDFDVSKSFVVQGNAKAAKGIKGFIFKPVIRATVDDLAGAIDGIVATGEANTALPNVPVEILQDTTVVSTAITDEKGYYAVIGLLPGQYWIRIDAEGYQLFELDGVLVEEKETTMVDIHLLPLPPATTE